MKHENFISNKKLLFYDICLKPDEITYMSRWNLVLNLQFCPIIFLLYTRVLQEYMFEAMEVLPEEKGTDSL